MTQVSLPSPPGLAPFAPAPGAMRSASGSGSIERYEELLRRMAQAQAMKHAIQAGAAGEHSYLPLSHAHARAAGWRPHEWVVRAIMEALRE